MLLGNIMTREVEVIHPDASLAEAANRMREAGIGFLPVTENDRLIGAVTDRDITIRATAEGYDPESARVRDAMSEDLFYGFEDQDVTTAAALMGARQVRRLPIVNRDRRLVGIVSLDDLATRAGDDRLTGKAAEEVSEDRSASITDIKRT
jgi:CBS domain-containing protein